MPPNINYKELSRSELIDIFDTLLEYLDLMDIANELKAQLEPNDFQNLMHHLTDNE